MVNAELKQRQFETNGEEPDWLGDDVPAFRGAEEAKPKEAGAEKSPKTAREMLLDKEFLNRISREYLDQYKATGETTSLSLRQKEYLDDYVVYMLKSPGADHFMQSEEFANYCRTITYISNNRTMEGDNGEIYYPELGTNPVFKDKDVREKVLQRSFSADRIDNARRSVDIHTDRYNERLRSIERRIGNREKLSQSQLDILADNIYLGRNYEDGRSQMLVEYCLNEIDEKDDIHASVPIIGAFANQCAKEYTIDEDVRAKSRIFIADHISGPDDGFHAGASTQYGIVLESKYFLPLSMTSDESMRKSRTRDSGDLYHLMMVSFHELTHDHQRNDLARGVMTPGAAAYAMNGILRRDRGCIPVVDLKTGEQRQGDYYEANHDGDEIEIDADEEAWRQCRAFIVSHCKRYGEEHSDQRIMKKYYRLRDRCKANEEEVRARRGFTRKKDRHGELVDPMYYDLETVTGKIQEDPSLLEQYPIFKKFFNEQGRLRPQLLVEEKIGSIEYEGFDERTDNIGAEIGTYLVTENAEVGSVCDFLRATDLSEKQVHRLMHNLWNIVHQDMLKMRALYDVDFNNYDETRTRINQSPQEINDSLLRGYLRRLYNCTRIAEVVRSKYPNLGGYIDEQEQMYLASYYHEMSKRAKLDPKLAEYIVNLYERTDNKSLANVAAMIRRDYDLPR